MRAILAGLATVVLTVAAGGFAAGQDEKIDGKLLVGKWVPKDKEKDITVEFTADGKMSYSTGPDFKAEGTYKVDGNKLSLKLKFGDEEKAQTRTILKLTQTELVTRAEGKEKEDALVRVADKK